MSDFDTGAVDPDLPTEPEVSVAAKAASDARNGEFVVGQRWRDLVIEGIAPGVGPRAYVANHLGLMERGVLRAFPVVEATEWRRGAWERLVALADSRTVRCIEAHEESGWRYEFTATPPPTTLREWMTLHRGGFAEIEAFVRQMSAALGALHAQGVVHLNIRPEAIFVDEAHTEPVFVLGGLHEATLYTQPKLAPSDVDPFYAPPETAGVDHHAPGTRLCAWDWWSVGRVVQEYLLGRHVMALVFERDVSRPTPELRARAELLLLEQEPPGIRAGALDYMPDDPATRPLLRGLLTSSVEARWGLDAVNRWLRRLPVQDHYDLPRSARLWSWRGRGFTLAEAADFFTQAENWETGEDVLFNATDPESLAYFLNEVRAMRADYHRLQALCDLTETAAWEEVPVFVRRTVTAALAWLSLAVGAGAKASLRVRGQAVDLIGLGELLRMRGVDEGVPLVIALLSPPVVQAIEPLDGPSARVLTAMAAKGGEAVRQALAQGWLDPHDTAGHARMLELALQSATVLREKVELLHAMFATCTSAPLAAMLTSKAPAASELVILTYTGEAPEKFGYITHENWRRQRCAELKARADRAATVLLWIRLQQLLVLGWLWGAPSQVFSGAVLVLTALAAWLSRSVEMAATVAGGLLLSRVWLWWRLRGLVQKFDPAAAPWEWRDGRQRCAADLARVLAGQRADLAALQRELHEIRGALAGLARPTSKSPAVTEPACWDVAGVFVLAAGLTIVVLADAVLHPPVRSVAVKPGTPAAVAVAAKPKPPGPPRPVIIDGLAVPADAAELLATGRYEIVDDGFGRRLRGPLRTWEFFAPAKVESVAVAARAPATADQSAYALVSGALLLQPYPRKGVSALLAVHVPTTRGFGIMLFNARDRALVDRQILLVGGPMEDNTWYQLGRQRVVYLGAPLAKDVEISLAQP